MTPHEKIKQHYMYHHLESCMFNDIYNEESANTFALEIEKIADEFAKNFYNWVQVCKRKGRPYDFDNVHELLKTFKEEE